MAQLVMQGEQKWPRHEEKGRKRTEEVMWRTQQIDRKPTSNRMQIQVRAVLIVCGLGEYRLKNRL
jgi:hypothetical protein